MKESGFSDPEALTGEERQRLRRLEEEVQRLRRTNEVLLDRVEHRINVEGGAFAAFQVASNLEKTVADRTTELRRLNERLEHELQLRRSFEAALLRAKTQAEEATASRTRFLAAASHDLRQPLNAAILYLASIDRDGLEQADAESLRGIGLALENLNSLLSALLDISRLDSGGLQPEPDDFPLHTLLQRLAREYEPVAQVKGLDLRVLATNAVVHSDIMLLETVLRNLLSNAIKYTREGRVLMGVRRRGDRVRIEIRDTGIGIAGEHLQRIFDEFWRAPDAPSADEGSTGLGLSIVERICRLLGTGIEVQSAPGRGSAFTLTLPLGDSGRVAGRTPPLLVPGTAGFNRCLVVAVDDNIQVLRSMERMLLSWDCRVVAATGVEEALTTIIDRDLEPTLLLTDYHLAYGANGIDAIDAINAELATPAQAIMISSDYSAQLREQLDQLGIPLLTKPVDPARLRAVMQHVLGSEDPPGGR
ncbi:MAG: hybrid sensor histidine kinase/response regulator [Halioglobus sp.]|jgi:signal transduction histidine kinase